MQKKIRKCRSKDSEEEATKEKLIDANSTRKSYSQSEHGSFQALEQEIVEFMCAKGKTDMLACEVIKYKGT
jgi:hypothetical protein